MSALLVDIQDGVATLTFNQPESRNSFSPAMREALTEAVPRVARDPEVRVVVLTGAGGVFCAGGDIRGMKERAGKATPQETRERMGELYQWVAELIEMDKPLIAAVDGAAFGAGFSLALAADMVLATPKARFCMSFMRIGLVPDCGAFYTLPRAVGVQRAKELMMTAREVDVQEALKLGIVMEVVEQPDLMPTAMRYATQLKQASRLATGLIKQRVGNSLGQDLRSVLNTEANDQGLCFCDPYNAQAVERFFAKEPPLFQWTQG